MPRARLDYSGRVKCDQLSNPSGGQRSRPRPRHHTYPRCVSCSHTLLCKVRVWWPMADDVAWGRCQAIRSPPGMVV
eukprot:4970381-Prymnesium_polylepis.1